MSFAAPAQSNTYVPSFQATDVVVQFTRNATAFRVNQYVKEIPVTKDQGFFLTLDPDEPARVVDEADYAWEDGADAPEGDEHKQEHQFTAYRTVRKAFPYRIGYKAAAQASWDVLASHAKVALAKAMTLRTLKACSLIFTGANWPAANTSAAANQWSNSTSTNAYIQKALMAAVAQIDLGSNGVVSDVDSLIIVIGPDMAQLIRQSPEFNDYIKSSPAALASLKGELREGNPNFAYGLPPYLWGIRVIVENASQVTTRKGATTARTRLAPAGKLAILSRPEGLVGEQDAPDFSTVAFRNYARTEVWSKDDPDNERHLGRVKDDYVVSLQAPQVGYLYTGIT